MSRKPEVFKGKKMKLYNVPEDVQRYIIERRDQEIINCDNCIRSQDYAIYKILREHRNIIGAKDVMVVGFNGQFLQLSEFDVSFEGLNIRITSKIELNTPLGMTLNYKRLESSKATGKEKEG